MKNKPKNICNGCGQPLLYAIECDRSKLWGLCKRCFRIGWLPNPPYNIFLMGDNDLCLKVDINRH